MAALGLPQQKNYELQEHVGWIFLILVALLSFVSLFVGYQFVMPTEGRYYTAVGQLDDFPPSSNPYVVFDEQRFVYLVNIDGQLDVFGPETPTLLENRCLFKWQEGNNRFEDPCTGSKFTLDGFYIEGPSARGLDMHPFYVNDEQEVMINFVEYDQGEPALSSPYLGCVRVVPESTFMDGVRCEEFNTLKPYVPHSQVSR